MSNSLEKNIQKERDPRITATTKIWSFATGIIALCLVFSSDRNTVTLPIAVAASAATGTAFVWLADKKYPKDIQQYQLEEIEQRLTMLETIAGNDDLEMWVKTRQLASRN